MSTAGRTAYPADSSTTDSGDRTPRRLSPEASRMPGALGTLAAQLRAELLSSHSCWSKGLASSIDCHASSRT